MENCFACRDTWPKSTVGKLSPSIQQTSSNRKVRTLVIYKPFINETSTIDFRLISDNRIDTKPRDGEGGEREKKERHEFHLCTRFRGPSNLFPAIAFETKQPLEKPPLIPVGEFRPVINLSSNILEISFGETTNSLPQNYRVYQMFNTGFRGVSKISTC